MASVCSCVVFPPLFGTYVHGGCWEFNCVHILSKENMFATVSHVVCLLPCGWAASKCPNLHLQTCVNLESFANPQLIQSTTGLQADSLQTSRWCVQGADFISSCNIGVTLLDTTSTSRPETKLYQIRIQKYVKEKVLKVSKFKFLET